ncbi:hypothetical protein BJ742DRAFT_804074 [Cladochytrium replicatum]|nr:hypothetical protein BJ742DRAFT_804074 [Cladochytrium replicatum]
MRTSAVSVALAAIALFSGSAIAAPASGEAAASKDNLAKRDYTSYSYGIEDWKTCHPGKDSCASYGSKCCIAKADKYSGKYTCRPAGKDCDDYGYSSDYSSDYHDGSYSADYYDDSTYYDDSHSYDDSYYYDDSYSGDYYDDYSGDSYDDYSSDYTSNGYYGARAKGHPARQANGAHHASRGSRHAPARARPQGNDHEYSYGDHCDVTYKVYIGNCEAAYAQDHKEKPYKECLDGAKAWLKICEAQTTKY